MKSGAAIAIDIKEKDKTEMLRISNEIIKLKEKSKLDDYLFSMIIENIDTAIKQELGINKILNVTKNKNIIDYDKYKRIANIVYGMQESHVNLLLFNDCPEVWFQYYLGAYLNKRTCIICEEKDWDILQKFRKKHPVVKVKSFDDKEAVSKAVKSLLEMYKDG